MSWIAEHTTSGPFWFEEVSRLLALQPHVEAPFAAHWANKPHHATSLIDIIGMHMKSSSQQPAT